MKLLKFKDVFAKKRKPKKLLSNRIEGKKVTLRKLVVSDAIYSHDTFEDLKFKIYHGFNNLNTIDDFMVYLMDYTARYETGESVGWAITSTKTKEFIGVIQVPNYYKEDRNCSLNFYTIKGLNDSYLIETLKLVCAYLFSTKLVRRIQVKLDAEDSFSEIVLIKSGFTYEGTQRKYAKYNDEFHDIKVYSLLEDEVELSEEVK